MGVGRIKGITIELEGNTTKLVDAMRKVDSQLKSTQTALRDVDKLLKLKPGNTELLTQKQKQLTTAIEQTKTRLQELKDAQTHVAEGTPEWDALQREIIETDNDLKNLEKEYRNFGSVAAQEIAAAGEKMKTIGTKMTEVGESMTKYVTAPIVAGFAASTKASLSYGDAIAKTSTLLDKNKMSTQELSKEIINLSNETGKGSSELAEAAYQALSASVNTQDVVEFTRTSANLAKAGFLETSGAVDVLTTVINAYGMEASDANRIAEQLIQTQNDGKTTVNELAASMGQVIPTAAALNIPLEQLNASYAILTKQGINTANSTTYLNGMFTELADGGSTVAKILQEKTGKTFGELMNSGATLGDVMQLLSDSVGGNSEEFLNLWGNVRAGKGALALLNGGVEEFNTETDKMKNATGNVAGALDELATPGAKARKALNQLTNAGIEIGDRFAPYVEKAATMVSKLIEKWDALSPATQNVIIKTALAAAAIGPLLVGGGRLLIGIGQLMTFAPKIASFGGIVAKGFGIAKTAIAGLSFNPVVLGIGAAIVAGVAIYKNWDKIKEGATKLKEHVSQKWDEFKTKTSETWDNAKTTMSTKFEQAKTAVTTKAEALKNGVSQKYEAMKTAATTKFESMKTAVTTKAEAMKTAATTKFESMKTSAASKFESMKSAAASKFESMKSTASSKWESMKSTAKSKFDGIKSAISDKITQAKNKVSSMVDAMKKKMHFSWSLPRLKLPHPHVYGKFSLNPPSVPHFSISWYRKAYANAIEFKRPTVLPTAAGWKGFGDGPGSEIVAGKSGLMRDITNAVAQANTGSYTFNIYTQPGQDAKEIAREVQKIFVREENQRKAAFA